jgi:AcrR family transcriptional regulator
VPRPTRGSSRGAKRATRGGWRPTGTSADRRATTTAAPGAKALRSRERLLEAARRVVASHGYANTTVDLIVAEAGVARGSFYTYFESKPHILGTLAASIDREIERNVVAFDRGRSDDPIANLEIANRNYLAVVRELADLYRLVEEVALHDESVREGRLRSHQRHVARVAKAIERWQQRGLADAQVDAEATAAALVAMLSGVAQWMYLRGDALDEERALAALNAACVRTCGLRRSA